MATLGPSEWLSGMLVVITGIYVVLTWRIAKSGEQSARSVAKQIEQLSRPFIYINIVSRHKTVLSIAISNGGRSSATNVQFSLDRPFYQFAEENEDRNLQNFNLFKNIVPSISPGDRFLIDLSQGFNINTEKNGKNLTPDEFIIFAKYEFGLQTYKEEFHVDIKPYFQTFAGEHEVEELINIGRHLKEVSSSLKIIASKGKS